MLVRTEPFKNIEEANTYRACAKNLRANSQKADLYSVEHAVHLKQNSIKKRGTNKEQVIRHFLRAFMQEVKPFPGLQGLRHQDVADMLEHVGVTLHKVKESSSRDIFVSNTISDTKANEEMIMYLLEVFKLEEIYEEVVDILIKKNRFKGGKQ